MNILYRLHKKLLQTLFKTKSSFLLLEVLVCVILFLTVAFSAFPLIEKALVSMYSKQHQISTERLLQEAYVKLLHDCLKEELSIDAIKSTNPILRPLFSEHDIVASYTFTIAEEQTLKRKLPPDGIYLFKVEIQLKGTKIDSEAKKTVKICITTKPSDSNA